MDSRQVHESVPDAPTERRLARVAFTGRVASMRRRELAEHICAAGGAVHETVSRRTSMLVVGGHGWPLLPDGSVNLAARLESANKQFGTRILIDGRTRAGLEDDSVDDRVEAWTRAERELLESLRDKARSLGANAVVGLEVTLDPFAQAEEKEVTGLRLHAVGTAAKLEPLF